MAGRHPVLSFSRSSSSFSRSWLPAILQPHHRRLPLSRIRRAISTRTLVMTGMLAAMTSLALLAHRHAAPGFNSTFYATAALLIPVLFLAIAVQGNAFQQVIKAPGRLAAAAAVSAREQLKAARRDEILKVSVVWLKLEAVRIAVWFLDFLAILILAAGAIGELLAIYALYQGHDEPGVRLTVLLSAALLTCAVIIEPVQAQVRIFRAVHERRRNRAASVRQERLGDVAAAAGDLAAARTAYQASLDIRFKLAAADPANTQRQRDLSIIQQKIDRIDESGEEA